jgi:hypothetical protein
MVQEPKSEMVVFRGKPFLLRFRPLKCLDGDILSKQMHKVVQLVCPGYKLLKRQLRGSSVYAFPF